MPAPRAEAWGLINRSVPASQFEETVDGYVKELLKMPPLSVRYTKAATNLLLDTAGFSTHLDAGAPMQTYLAITPDGREAKQAFNERRQPVFTGDFPSVPSL